MCFYNTLFFLKKTLANLSIYPYGHIWPYQVSFMKPVNNHNQTPTPESRYKYQLPTPANRTYLYEHQNWKYSHLLDYLTFSHPISLSLSLYISICLFLVASYDRKPSSSFFINPPCLVFASNSEAPLLSTLLILENNPLFQFAISNPESSWRSTSIFLKISTSSSPILIPAKVSEFFNWNLRIFYSIIEFRSAIV